jgi:hypothetical protein
MEKCALVLIQPQNGRPLPVVQNTGYVDEDIALIIHHLVTLQILDMYTIPSLLIVPCCTENLMLRLHVLVQTEFACKVIEVREDLFRAGVHD